MPYLYLHTYAATATGKLTVNRPPPHTHALTHTRTHAHPPTSISVATADLVNYAKSLTHVALPYATTGSLEDFAGADKLKYFSANGAEGLEGTHTHQVT